MGMAIRKNGFTSNGIHIIKYKSVNQTVLNVLLFQIGWFACVLGGNLVAVLITPIILIIHGKYLVQSPKEWLLIAGFGVTGLIVDSLLATFTLFTFGDGFFANAEVTIIPVWLLCLWFLFATTLCHSLVWLQNRLPLAIVLGFFAGPSSYFAGSKIAQVMLAEPIMNSLMIIGVCWAIIFPLGLLIGRRYQS